MRPRGADRLLRAAWLGVAAFAVVLIVVAAGRDVFNYNTETDYLGGFVQEATRLLRGESLAVDFHPPLYPISIVVVNALVRDWFATGVLVSIAASVATLAITLVLFLRMLGAGAAIGAAVALLISPTFVYYSLQATSELFSLALYMGAFLAVYASIERPSRRRYLLAGFVIGLGLVARTNNVVLLGLLLFYLVPSVPRGPALPRAARLTGAGGVLAGICVPVLLWYGFAAATGAPFMPTKNHENLALTYFSDGSRLSGDARRPLAEQFTSTREVLLADPGRIARIYVTDLRNTTFRLLARDTVLPAPLVALGLLAWLGILVRERGARLLLAVLLLNLAAMYLLLNLKYYEHRYYLYLVPFVGAAVGYMLQAALRGSSRAIRSGAVVLAAAAIVLGSLHAWSETARLHASDWSTDALAAARYLGTLEATGGSVIYARKPHAAFYADAQSETIPQLTDLEELVEHLLAFRERATGPVYVFYGRPERDTRPQFSALGDPAAAGIPGLQLVASGPERDGWFLYAVDDASAGPATGRLAQE